jgi:hypothetical protein
MTTFVIFLVATVGVLTVVGLVWHLIEQRHRVRDLHLADPDDEAGWFTGKKIFWIVVLFPLLMIVLPPLLELWVVGLIWGGKQVVTRASVAVALVTEDETEPEEEPDPTTPLTGAAKLSLKGNVEAIPQVTNGETVAGRAGILCVLPPGAPTLNAAGEPVSAGGLGVSFTSRIPGIPVDPSRPSSDGLTAHRPLGTLHYLIDGSIDPATSPLELERMMKEVETAIADGRITSDTVYIWRVRFPFRTLPGNPNAYPLLLRLATDSKEEFGFTHTRILPQVEEWFIRPRAPRRQVRIDARTKKQQITFVELESFVVPASGWESMWVMALEDEAYAGEMGSTALPIAGLTQAQTKAMLRTKSSTPAMIADLEKDLREKSPLPLTQLGWWGLYYQVDGKRYPLTDGGKSFVAKQYRGKKVSFGINIPEHSNYSPTKFPKIRFGIEWTKSE